MYSSQSWRRARVHVARETKRRVDLFRFRSVFRICGFVTASAMRFRTALNIIFDIYNNLYIVVSYYYVNNLSKYLNAEQYKYV